MFDFLKKKSGKAAASASSSADKDAKNAAREQYIHNVMAKTGWEYECAKSMMSGSKKAFGISYKNYDKYDFFNTPALEQANRYAEISSKKSVAAREAEKAHAIECVMKVTGWNYDKAFKNMQAARKRTGCTFKEYFIYRFYDLDEEQQKEFFLICHSKMLRKKYDVDKDLISMLCNKEKTNEFFSEYLRRPWCVNTKISRKDFASRFADSKRVIYKPLGGNRGKGVEAFDITKDNVNEVYDKVSSYPDGVVEQYVVQHPEVSKLAPSSVNTLRVVTISDANNPVTADGKHVDVAYAALRIGGGSSVVDNFHSGGMVAAVDLETGKLDTDAADMEGRVFRTHPVTGQKIKGFEIPCFKEAVDMALDACRKHNITGYLGWDIAITQDGPVLIEVNAGPGVVLLSTPYAPAKIGKKYVMDKYL